MDKDIYDLKLHETTEIIKQDGLNYYVTRVAGGWIYQYMRLDCNSMTSVFVPFNNEFKGESNG